MQSRAVLYGPKGFISEIDVAVDHRASCPQMRLRLPVSVDELLMQVSAGKRRVCGAAVSVKVANVMNRHEILISRCLPVEVLVDKTRNPNKLGKVILVGREGLFAFRTHAGPRRHGSLSGLLQLSVLRRLGEPLLIRDSIDFLDGSSSWLPHIRGLDRTTEVLLPRRCVTFGETVRFSCTGVTPRSEG